MDNRFRQLAESIARQLNTEAGYGLISAEALGRGWAQLGIDLEWPDEDTQRIAMECSARRGIMPDTVRSIAGAIGGPLLMVGILGPSASRVPSPRATPRPAPTKATKRSGRATR